MASPTTYVKQRKWLVGEANAHGYVNTNNGGVPLDD
jgi:hypothetical protein